MFSLHDNAAIFIPCKAAENFGFGKKSKRCYIVIGNAFCSRVGALREAQSQMVRSLVGCVDCAYQKWLRYRYQEIPRLHKWRYYTP